MSNLQRFEMSDRVYEGKSPQYKLYKDQLGQVHALKVVKGVPFRKVEVDDRQAKIEARRARRAMRKAQIAYSR